MADEPTFRLGLEGARETTIAYIRIGGGSRIVYIFDNARIIDTNPRFQRCMRIGAELNLDSAGLTAEILQAAEHASLSPGRATKVIAHRRHERRNPT